MVQENIQIENIVKRIAKDDFSSTSKRILDFMVVNHCAIHPIKTKDLQKIEQKLNIQSGKLLLNQYKHTTNQKL